MENNAVTVDEAYKKLKHEFKTDISQLETKCKPDMSKMRAWFISLFIGSVIIIGTLIGAYANITITLLK